MHTKIHTRFLTIILLSVALLSGHDLNAQKFKAGLSFGLVSTDISGAENRHPHNVFIKLGFSAGGLINIQMNSKWRFQFELNYTQKGSSLPKDPNHVTFYKIALNYVEMPLLFKRRFIIKLPEKTWDKLELEAGLSIGKLVSEVVTGYSNFVIPAEKYPFNLYEPAILFGVNYRLFKSFYFCFRYSNGLIPVIKRGTPVTTSRPLSNNSGNNMVFLFSIKYIIGTSKQRGNLTPGATVE